MTLHRWLVVSLVVGSVCAGLARRAHADNTPSASDVARAESYAAEAFDAYTRKDYPAAVSLYLKAWDAAATADILYNLARIYDGKLKDRQTAIEYYRRYIRDPGAEPARVRSSNERLSQLLELESLSAQTPAARPPFEPGLGNAAALSSDALRTGQTTPSRDHGISSMQVLGIVALSTGVAGLAIGAGFGLSAKSDASIADTFCNGNACSSQRGVDASHDASDAATISTIAFVAGGVLSALGAVTLVLASSRDDREHPKASLSLTPVAGPHLVGTHIAGRW
jgi:hypothetical protein